MMVMSVVSVVVIVRLAVIDVRVAHVRVRVHDDLRGDGRIHGRGDHAHHRRHSADRRRIWIRSLEIRD
jgi:hypothetical protein